MSEVYDIGDQIRIGYTFKNSSGMAADPTTITLWLKTPAGAETSHVYLTDGNLIRDATGVYHYDLTFAESGTYCWRWAGTGAVVCAEEGQLPVRRSKFTTP